MVFEIPKNSYNGKINNLKLGVGNSQIMVGGEAALPFHGFEGDIPNRPIIAMEVYDAEPSGWPETVSKYFKDVFSDPVKWARKNIEEYGADAICLKLTRIAPDGENQGPEEAAELTKKVRESIDKPLIVYGTGPIEKIAEVMKRVSERNADSNILMGWAEEDSYKTIAAAAMGYNNNVISLNQLDVNIAKQLNILLTQLGLSPDRIAMDPASSGLGYGLEYCHSAMERLKIAALLQDDKMTQMPIINDIAPEVWKVKEVKESEANYPEWGDQEERGINWEAISCMSLLISGSNILVMRHPGAVSLIKQMIDMLL
ncbi:MAG: acetyl-CoA decarbonylase/synthase complex subunit delta [Actinobacteria bacterium]|nr:acetyl-CoA decarbonylase/synthase complex subunit delta [Actinomycetota bacterium]